MLKWMIKLTDTLILVFVIAKTKCLLPMACQKRKTTLKQVVVTEKLSYFFPTRSYTTKWCRTKVANQHLCFLHKQYTLFWLYSCTVWFAPDLVGNPKDTFSRFVAKIYYNIISLSWVRRY